MLTSTFKNSGQGSAEGNPVDGFCIATVKYPSPGFYVMEIWRDIKGYEGFYKASNFGRIKSLTRCVSGTNNAPRILKGKIRRQTPCQGYLHITLCKDGIMKTFSTHRLVAVEFIPNPENKPTINHVNGIKSDNRIENLEWCTPSENILHAFRTGLSRADGENHNRSKLNEFQVRVIRKCHDLFSKELAKIFNVHESNIRQIKIGITWTSI